MAGQPNKYFPPTLALLFAAVIWGTVWYPYRLLEGQGLQGTPATFLTYLVTFFLVLIFFAKSWREYFNPPAWFFALALVSGWTNYAYVMGTIEGEVMRVLLLFYLAPVWTLPLARWILGERPSTAAILWYCSRWLVRLRCFGGRNWAGLCRAVSQTGWLIRRNCICAE